MASLARVCGGTISEVEDKFYVGGLWALREIGWLNITHVVSLVSVDLAAIIQDQRGIQIALSRQAPCQLNIHVDDSDATDLLAYFPRAVRFIATGLADGGVLVHCAAGKSRSVTVTAAFLLWRDPARFWPTDEAGAAPRSRGATAREAVAAALELIRRARPLADPNDGFVEQLALWWEMGCPDDVSAHPIYQRWVYRREVEESVAAGQAPSRLRFEDQEPQEPQQPQPQQEDARAARSWPSASGPSLRCKRCRRTLANAAFVQAHQPAKGAAAGAPCPHIFVEPLSWMRGELERGELSGRLACPLARCGAIVGRYDWRGLQCACGSWVTPGLALQRARVDEDPGWLAPAGAGAGVGAGAEPGAKPPTEADAAAGSGRVPKPLSLRLQPGNL